MMITTRYVGQVSRAVRRGLALTMLSAAMLVTPTLSVAPAHAHAAIAQQPAAAQPATPQRPAQDEFVPVTDLPDSEKLPAAPFLIAAYTLVWVVLLVYVWSLWRRLTAVEQELKHAVQSVGRDHA
jgi:CcmD family protein